MDVSLLYVFAACLFGSLVGGMIGAYVRGMKDLDTRYLDKENRALSKKVYSLGCENNDLRVRLHNLHEVGINDANEFPRRDVVVDKSIM